MSLPLHLEDTLFTAMKHSDVTALAALIADDLLFINHAGQRVTKSQDIGLHMSGAITLEAIERESFRAQESEHCIIVDTCVAITGTYAGEPLNGRFHHFRTWVNRNGQWQVLGLKTTLL
ncbi:nuclear transport factor 2 family protein [Cronobacter muytjensii]|uniref:nuclear transport factor 2 family protein n=1 Tax=Cronobacter muytjensii TaxID=413501 RepID=UPI00158806AE|nr:nuclear transport factor 2 family protein [Cronobacter muytjensii]NUW60608.1 nuclear transport factor 2 family protein [Cronobacter muytjensii]